MERARLQLDPSGSRLSWHDWLFLLIYGLMSVKVLAPDDRSPSVWEIVAGVGSLAFLALALAAPSRWSYVFVSAGFTLIGPAMLMRSWVPDAIAIGIGVATFAFTVWAAWMVFRGKTSPPN